MPARSRPPVEARHAPGRSALLVGRRADPGHRPVGSGPVVGAEPDRCPARTGSRPRTGPAVSHTGSCRRRRRAAYRVAPAGSRRPRTTSPSKGARTGSRLAEAVSFASSALSGSGDAEEPQPDGDRRATALHLVSCAPGVPGWRGDCSARSRRTRSSRALGHASDPPPWLPPRTLQGERLGPQFDQGDRLLELGLRFPPRPHRPDRASPASPGRQPAAPPVGRRPRSRADSCHRRAQS